MNRQAGNAQLIQKANRLKVLHYIRRNPDVPRPAIAQQTGLSVSSLTNITSYLLDMGLLCENGMEHVDRVGRKGTLLRFRAEAYNLICVFLNQDSIRISLTDLEGNMITDSQIPTSNLQPQSFIDMVHDKVMSLIQKYGKERILGIEIAISGLILNESRFVISASLKWTEFNLREKLEKETGIPVFLGNLSVIRAVWYFCCSKQHANEENMLLVDLENGIGACQYYQGEINQAMLGEIGHTTVEKDGPPCFCGNNGCLEAMCSVQRIGQLYDTYSGTTGADVSQIAAQYAAGNDAAVRAVSECAQYLGIGLANLVNLCKPLRIVINTGSLTPLPAVIELAKKTLSKRAYPALLETLTVCETSISEEDAVHGAAFHLCDQLFDLSYPHNIVE